MSEAAKDYVPMWYAGQIEKVPRAQVDRASASGYRIASDQDVADWKEIQRFKRDAGPLEKAATHLTAAAEGAAGQMVGLVSTPFGVSGQEALAKAEAKFTDKTEEEAAAGQRQRAMYAPKSQFAGEVAGAVIPGGGVVGLTKGLAAKSAAMGAEAFLGSMSSEANQAFLEDREWAVEQVAQNAIMPAIIGGLLPSAARIGQTIKPMATRVAQRGKEALGAHAKAYTMDSSLEAANRITDGAFEATFNRLARQPGSGGKPILDIGSKNAMRNRLVAERDRLTALGDDATVKDINSMIRVIDDVSGVSATANYMNRHLPFGVAAGFVGLPHAAGMMAAPWAARQVGQQVVRGMMDQRTWLTSTSELLSGKLSGVTKAARRVARPMKAVEELTGNPVVDSVVIRSWYADAEKELTQAGSNGQALLDSAKGAFAGIEQIEPSLIPEAMVRAQAMVAYLNTQRPQSVPLYMAMPEGPRTMPSNGELMSYYRKYRAATNPLWLLREMDAGYVNRETIEAVQALHPVFYSTVQQGVLKQLGQMTEPPTGRARLVMESLLDNQGAVYAANSSRFYMRQKLYAEQAAQKNAPKGPPPKPGRRTPTLNQQNRSVTQRMQTIGN